MRGVYNAFWENSNGNKAQTLSEGCSKFKFKSTQTSDKPRPRIKQQKNWSKGHDSTNFTNYFRPKVDAQSDHK